MRAIKLVCAMLGLVLAPVAAAAQPVGQAEAEALRRELEQMRRQFEAVRQDYQRALDALGERLQRLEARPQPAAAAPAPAPQVAQTPPAAQPPPPTALDYLRPRPPFSLADRTGGRPLLFDMGVVADFIGNYASTGADRADLGTFSGRENRFFPREIELNLFGQIDPYARGEMRIEAAEEFEDGERELHLGLAEAHLTLLTLPFGTQAKLGLMRARFGLLNQFHREGLPQPDQPGVLTRFFGEEGLRESGLEFTWVPPLPFYVETLVGVFNGDNEDAFGHGNLRHPLVTGRLRTFTDLTDSSALQVGVSGAFGRTDNEQAQTFAGLDLKYKLTPEGWRHPLLTAAGEAIWSWRDVHARSERQRYGWYAYAEVQPWKQWAGGLRYDWTQFLEDSGHEWAVEPYLAYMPSDFLRFRLAYKRSERTGRGLFVVGGEDARIANEIFFQATFFLGAHQPHPF
jgi:hypothetical protein